MRLFLGSLVPAAGFQVSSRSLTAPCNACRRMAWVYWTHEPGLGDLIQALRAEGRDHMLAEVLLAIAEGVLGDSRLGQGLQPLLPAGTENALASSGARMVFEV